MDNTSTTFSFSFPHLQTLSSEIETEATIPFNVTADDVNSEGFQHLVVKRLALPII